ncbi:hypothetical protein B0H14DRAFT_2790818 [Mycena olivaceomarginata]|nr:hypothetical protein B0H14DRAFT_2790818 [Mycena olivaceomarginata]
MWWLHAWLVAPSVTRLNTRPLPSERRSAPFATRMMSTLMDSRWLTIAETVRALASVQTSAPSMAALAVISSGSLSLFQPPQYSIRNLAPLSPCLVLHLPFTAFRAHVGIALRTYVDLCRSWDTHGADVRSTITWKSSGIRRSSETEQIDHWSTELV